MKIAVIGGGPGGLYFSALAKQLGPHHEITVWERNAADDTFGFGVVFSDETLGGIEHADPAVYARDAAASSPAGTTSTSTSAARSITSGGHGFAAMSRTRLLEILQERCRELGVTLHFRTEAPDVDELAAHARPGASPPTGSTPRVRARYADTFRPDPRRRGTASTCGWAPTKVFDAFKFYIRETPYGVMQIHGYPFDATGSHVHRGDARGRLAARRASPTSPTASWRPGESDEKSIAQVTRALRRRARRPRGDGQQLALDLASRPSATSPGATATSCCSATPPTPPTSPSAPAPSWRWRTRSRSPPACTRSRPSTTALAAYEAERTAGRALHPARGAGQPGVVREPRAVRPPGARRSSPSTS